MSSGPDNAYVIVAMCVICLVGIVGNTLSLVVLLHPKHRRETMSPFMVNLSVAHLLVSVAEYPSIVLTKSSIGNFFYEHPAWCDWSAFSNGTTGVAAFATNALMALIMYRGLNSDLPPKQRSKRKTALWISGTWVYATCANLPPLIGWNKFVPGRAGMSCAPDWTSSSPRDRAHMAVLMVLGFFVPVTVIGYCYYQMYRILSKDSPALRNNSDVQVARRRSVKSKAIRTISVSAVTLFLSWSPYAVVSLVSMFKGENELSVNEAEVPELLAKASVIYNPMVYIFMNARFCSTLKKIANRICLGVLRRRKLLHAVSPTKPSRVVHGPRRSLISNVLAVALTCEVVFAKTDLPTSFFSFGRGKAGQLQVAVHRTQTTH